MSKSKSSDSGERVNQDALEYAAWSLHCEVERVRRLVEMGAHRSAGVLDSLVRTHADLTRLIDGLCPPMKPAPQTVPESEMHDLHADRVEEEQQ